MKNNHDMAGQQSRNCSTANENGMEDNIYVRSAHTFAALDRKGGYKSQRLYRQLQQAWARFRKEGDAGQEAYARVLAEVRCQIDWW